MTESPDAFENLNNYSIVHIYNRSNVYHLTRQVLLDSAFQIPTDESMTQNTYSFFYHILSKDADDFNDTYSSFAYIDTINSNKPYQPDLYMNVDSVAFDCIVEYVQTRKINKKIVNLDDINQIIDLSTIFAMPDLVNQLRNKLPSETYVKNKTDIYKRIITLAMTYISNYKNDSTIEQKANIVLDDFFNDNKELISDMIVNSYNSDKINVQNKIIALCLELIMATINASPDSSDIEKI